MFTPQPLPFEMETVTSLVVPTDMCRCKEKGCVHVCVCVFVFELKRLWRSSVEGHNWGSPLHFSLLCGGVLYDYGTPAGEFVKKKIQNNNSIFVFTFYWANLRTFRFCSFMYVNCCQSWLKSHIHGLFHVNFGEFACTESKTFKGESWCSYLCSSECCLCICTLGGTLTAALICLTLQTPNKCKEEK